MNHPAGKGSAPRPYSVDQDQFADNWARTFRAADVAKVGQQIPADKPLPPTVWRRQVRYLAQALLMCLAVVAVSGLTVLVMR